LEDVFLEGANYFLEFEPEGAWWALSYRLYGAEGL
jgi:hypothetical protein